MYIQPGLSPHSVTASRRCSSRAKDRAEGAQRQHSFPPVKAAGDLPSTVTLVSSGCSSPLDNRCFQDGFVDFIRGPRLFKDLCSSTNSTQGCELRVQIQGHIAHP